MSRNGKGSARREEDRRAFDEGYDAVFGSPKKESGTCPKNAEDHKKERT